MKLRTALMLNLMLCLIVLMSACSKKAVMDAEPASAPAVGETTAAPEPITETAAAAAAPATLTGSRLEPIYFDYDSHLLSPDAHQILNRNAALLRQESGLFVTIEGHCDERGSDEYNLALGEQRAVAVKRYLVTAGVAANRLTVISYGEERPSVTGSDEAAWSRNRRAAFN